MFWEAGEHTFCCWFSPLLLLLLLLPALITRHMNEPNKQQQQHALHFVLPMDSSKKTHAGFFLFRTRLNHVCCVRARSRSGAGRRLYALYST